MQKIIISDTSCLIQFELIGELNLLKRLFGSVTITPEIAEEFHSPIPDWIIIEAVKNTTYQKILETSVDIGEASAIALAIEHSDCLLTLDDWKGRKLAEKLGLTITGTLGILINAKLNGLIATVKPYLAKMKQTGFRLAIDLEKQVLQKSGELK
jgi:predicted nucleic acid-binding protein